MLQTKEQIKLAAKLLKLPIEKVREYGSVIKDTDLFYLSEPVKGGRSLIVGQDGTVLFANSSIDYDRHIEEFNNGRRTPIEDFV